MALDYCQIHDHRWDRDWHTECPHCRDQLTFENNLQDVSEDAWHAMGEIGAHRWKRSDDNAHIWDAAEKLTAELSKALTALKAACEPAEDDARPEPPMTRPIMGAWNGKSI